ncbi:Putative oxidoreductase YteT precursor [Lacunisphaera limnophila]|uniref:Oxidoreductase YteT n=1 Tax=Lacunisphaera limnophila TaxID=1838286 RepID=A0A1D8AYI0_9BACT|nr:Gfo/Idh/MocA family oxidoreductase [Lacunisphaera limnophila]AOS45921.1 Putative oxidoreductase YteT precursor [Lacunisphaera limnophila]
MKTPAPRPDTGASAGIVPFNVSRRAFLQRCGLIAAATGLPAWFVERQQLQAAETEAAIAAKPSANGKPGIALVGCGGMGTWDGQNAGNHGNLVAVCDVDPARTEAAAVKYRELGHNPEKVSDFRRLLERDDIHVIVNATPDHWHTLINIAAAKAKKDIYSEKPLTLTVDEGRHVIAAVRENKVILQTGTQQRSSQRFRLACELVRNGRLGKLKQAKVWLPAGLIGGPFAPTPAPDGLNWDYWQGQAPAVSYVKERCHGTFRFWYEYSGGTMTDWGAHHNDIAYWAIGQIAPTQVESRRLSEPVAGGYNAIADYEVKYTYADGTGLIINTTKDDSIYGEHVNPQGQPNGIRFEGTDGWIWVNRDEIKASDPELLRKPLPDDAQRLYVSKEHMTNFFDCVRSRELPICDVETGHRSANMCHLGAISLRTQRALTWDYTAEKFTGEHAAEANPYLKREMRAPYDYSFCG